MRVKVKARVVSSPALIWEKSSMRKSRFHSREDNDRRGVYLHDALIESDPGTQKSVE